MICEVNNLVKSLFFSLPEWVGRAGIGFGVGVSVSISVRARLCLFTRSRIDRVNNNIRLE